MDTRERLENALVELVEFVERVAKGNASQAEIQNLPEAMRLLEHLLEGY